jgi:uncharacterized membrane protein YdjX (TVP38/TMEM64 family)
MSPRARARLRLGIIVAIASGAMAFTALVVVGPEAIADRIGEPSPATAALFVVVATAMFLLTLPIALIAGTAGLIFGLVPGLPLTLAALLLGSATAWTISRRIGAEAVEAMENERVRAARIWVARRGMPAVILLRLSPIPSGLVNYSSGLSGIGLGTFLTGTAIGLFPRCFAYVTLGGSLEDLGSPTMIAAVAMIAVLAAGGAYAAWRWPLPAEFVVGETARRTAQE